MDALYYGVLNRMSDEYHYDPDKHIPDLSSKVIVLTGANAGIGKEAAIQLAKHNPKLLYLTTRSQAKFDAAMKDIRVAAPNANIEYLELDLASFESVKRAADKVLSSSDRLDVLINNAGIMGQDAGLTREGYEIHFGTNHMGPALLTKLLLPLLLKTASQPNSDVRIVNVSSGAHMGAPKTGFLPDQATTEMLSYHWIMRYSQSKLANVLHAHELAKRFPSITTTAIHPGRVESSLLDHFYATHNRDFYAYLQTTYDWLVGTLPTNKGAWSELWAATWPDKSKLVNGAYYVPTGKLLAPDKRGHNDKLSNQLWDWQEEEFKKNGFE